MHPHIGTKLQVLCHISADNPEQLTGLPSVIRTEDYSGQTNNNEPAQENALINSMDGSTKERRRRHHRRQLRPATPISGFSGDSDRRTACRVAHPAPLCTVKRKSLLIGIETAWLGDEAAGNTICWGDRL